MAPTNHPSGEVFKTAASRMGSTVDGGHLLFNNAKRLEECGESTFDVNYPNLWVCHLSIEHGRCRLLSRKR